jgi:hypothetical protein
MIENAAFENASFSEGKAVSISEREWAKNRRRCD